MGLLTTHVLDTANGIPAPRVKIELYAVTGDGAFSALNTMLTNDDGRCDSALLEGDAFSVGIYELRFHVGSYFEQQRKPDISYAKRKICWEPTIDLIEGLKQTINYFEKILKL